MKLLKIYSEGCGPCKVLEKNLKEADIQYENINAESEQGEEIIKKYLIRGVPTLLLIDDEGRVINRHTGLLGIEDLKKFTNETD